MKNHRKKNWRIVCFTLVLSLLCAIVGVAAVSDAKEPKMSLTKEIAQKEEVLSYFLNSSDKSVAAARTDSSQLDAAALEKLLAPYIPEGARGSSLLVTEHVVYLDYFMDEVRYTVSYYDTGLVKKIARGINDDIIYSSTSEKASVATVDAKSFLKTDSDVVASEDSVQARNASVNSVYASVKEVFPIHYEDVSGTAPFKGRQIMQGFTRIEAFAGTEYDEEWAYRVYETMYYHERISSQYEFNLFEIATDIETIATICEVATTTALNWLNVGGVLLSAYNVLQEACKVVEEDAYEFQGGREFYIWDPTVHSAFVEAYDYWGLGQIKMFWNYTELGYRDPSWGHDVLCGALTYDRYDFRDEGIEAYNLSILTNGRWIQGVGNGIGY